MTAGSKPIRAAHRGSVQPMAFAINTMDGRSKKFFRMDLPGLPERPARASRLRLTAACTSRDMCRVTVEDLGFGGFYESSGLTWEDTLPL